MGLLGDGSAPTVPGRPKRIACGAYTRRWAVLARGRAADHERVVVRYGSRSRYPHAGPGGGDYSLRSDQRLLDAVAADTRQRRSLERAFTRAGIRERLRGALQSA